MILSQQLNDSALISVHGNGVKCQS